MARIVRTGWTCYRNAFGAMYTHTTGWRVIDPCGPGNVSCVCLRGAEEGDELLGPDGNPFWSCFVAMQAVKHLRGEYP